MQIIAHRINSIANLQETSVEFGVEVDIRSHGSNLIIHHDPFESGELFDDWMKEFRHKTLILNVKEEGLEPSLIKNMSDHKCEDFFFLDQSFPFLVKYAEACKGRSAVRFSEFEGIETVVSLSGRVDWVWVDCFSKMPLDRNNFALLKENAFKICLVSPELHGFSAVKTIPAFRETLRIEGIELDAVCTKHPELWSSTQ